VNLESGTGQVDVFPNPSKGIYTIESSITTTSFLEVYNVLGQQVYSASLYSTNGGSFEMNLSAQPSGIYLYRFFGENGKFLGEGKLIIQK
jgi:hypothetical protein